MSGSRPIIGVFNGLERPAWKAIELALHVLAKILLPHSLWIVNGTIPRKDEETNNKNMLKCDKAL